jgi:hypothetical protein
VRKPSRNSTSKANVQADDIGYFPQMVISSISIVVLLLILVVREFDIIGLQAEIQQKQAARSSLSPTPSCSTPPRNSLRRFTGDKKDSSDSKSLSFHSSINHSRPPSSPTRNSSPDEIQKWERDRMERHLSGQFVFPPIQRDLTHRPQTSSGRTVRPSMVHRKFNTMTRIRLMEAGQLPQYDRTHRD